MALFAIPTHLAINGKIYSARFASSDDEPSILQFNIHPSHTDHSPSIKLHITALRPIRKSENTSKTPEYEVNLFFPKDGIINYSYRTPAQSSDVDRAFRVPGNQDTTSLRCLNFGAKGIIVETGLGGVPRLRTEQMGIDLARLLTTVKNVNEIPEAVLEISCLFSNANRSTDSAIHTMEDVIFANPASPSTSTSAHSSPVNHVQKRRQHLTMDSLFSKFKHQHSGSESSSAFDTPLSSPLPVADGTKSFSSSKSKETTPQQNKFDQWLSKAKTGASNPLKKNSPPKALGGNKGRVVCFNCYEVGHQEGACEAPKRIPKNQGGILKDATMGESSKSVEKVEAEEKATDDEWYCHNCNSDAHPDWWCPEPRYQL